MDTFGLGGICIKKPRGVIGYEKMHFCDYFSGSEGSRTMAQRLGGVEGKKYKGHFFVGGWCGELTGYIWLGCGLV